MHSRSITLTLACTLMALTLVACTTPPAPAPAPTTPSGPRPAPAPPPVQPAPAPAPTAHPTPVVTPLPLPALLNKRTESARRLQPLQIWQLVYQGKPAFYVVEDCCDRMNTLHDGAGYARCAPTGGIAGRGDGRCPAPLPSTEQMRLVWERAK